MPTSVVLSETPGLDEFLEAGDQAATLEVNSRTEHIRFRYMHMNPQAMNADGLLNGRFVSEGEKIGVISNYLDHPGGTDGRVGNDTMKAIRDFQQRAGIVPADGYGGLKVLAKLRQGS